MAGRAGSSAGASDGGWNESLGSRLAVGAVVAPGSTAAGSTASAGARAGAGSAVDPTARAPAARAARRSDDRRGLLGQRQIIATLAKLRRARLVAEHRHQESAGLPG
jgi:hypothetical protein